MSKELIIDVRSTEIDIAILENKQLIELHKEKSNIAFAVGDIYLGRVKKVMPGLNAAFVDVGYEKDAFLHYQDMGPQFRSLQKFLNICMSQRGRATSHLQKFKNEPDIDKKGKISDVLTAGQPIVVQVVKEPISTKGPRLSSEISIAGRNMVLMPFYDKISISQKIESNTERDRLRSIISSIKPRNFGVIIRTVATDQKVTVFDSEMRSLIRRFESAFENIHEGKVPRLLLSEINRTSAILRDLLNASFNNIYVNNEDVYDEIREYLTTIAPDRLGMVKLYQSEEPIFESFGIEKSIKALFGKTVSIKSGAYLIIEHTEALHVIDVNSGKKSKTAKDQETTAVEANQAALQEIARQLRLRDMGGIIVIDFIDMAKNEHKQLIFEKMKEAMAEDRAKHNILPLSKFGLMQITRQRVRPEMNIDTFEKCPACNGSGEISPSILLVDEIENRLSTILQTYEGNSIQLRVHPYVASFITKKLFSIRLKWMLKFKLYISIRPSMSMHMTGYRFYNSKKQEIKL